MSDLVETTEPEHSHLCEDCGQIWYHADESCIGPRFTSYGGPYYDCPLCWE